MVIIMFVERLNQILISRKIPKGKLLADLGMGKNQFKNWEKGTKPNMATVSAIAGYLHVDPEYLMGLSNTPEIGGAVRSTPDERLLDAFHQLNAEGKDLVLDYVERLTEKPRYTTESAIKVYHVPTAKVPRRIRMTAQQRHLQSAVNRAEVVVGKKK